MAGMAVLGERNILDFSMQGVVRQDELQNGLPVDAANGLMSKLAAMKFPASLSGPITIIILIALWS